MSHEPCQWQFVCGDGYSAAGKSAGIQDHPEPGHKERSPMATDNTTLRGIAVPGGPAIADQVTSGSLPGGSGGAGSPPIAGTTFTVAVTAEREYVAGSRLQWYSTYPRALPWSIDDVSTDFGADLYERMMLDAQVRSVVNVLKASILETGVSVSSAIADKDDPDYELARDLAVRAEYMFGEMESSIDDVLWDLLDGVALGNRIAEQVYALDTTPTGKQQYSLQTLSVKPRESYAFVVDVYFNVLGILGRIPGQPFPVQQGTLLANIETTTNFLPRSKFAVYSFRPRNADPRGTSVLRPAFSPWNEKLQIRKEYLKYLTQFASPSLIGYTAPEAQPYPVFNADGTPAIVNGAQVQQTPEQDMLAALEAFANGTATVFPHGALVSPIMMNGAGEAFINAIRLQNSEIAKAVLNQTLATEEAEHQTRASSSIHKDVLDTIIRQQKRPIERMLERDVLTTWLRLNGEEALLRLRPKVTLGTAAQEDMPSLWTAAAALYKVGYVHSSQLTEMDELLGMPAREPSNATTVPENEIIQVKGGLDGPVPTPTGQGDPQDDDGPPAKPAPKPARPSKKTGSASTTPAASAQHEQDADTDPRRGNQ